MLEYSIIQNVYSDVIFSVAHAINFQIEAEYDCLQELNFCSSANDLKFFVESLSELNRDSYKKLETYFLDAFLRLIIGYTTKLLIELIKHNQEIEKKSFGHVLQRAIWAKKLSQYGYKKLSQLESIAMSLRSPHDHAVLFDAAGQILIVYEMPFDFKIGTKTVFWKVLNGFLAYQDRLSKLSGLSFFYSSKQSLIDQIKSQSKRLLCSGMLSYGLLNGFVYHFFGHIAALKNDFEVKQKAFIDSQTKLTSAEPLCASSFLPHSNTAKAGSFDVNYFAQKEAEWKKSYLPFSLGSIVSDLFSYCHIIIQGISRCHKDLFSLGSQTARVLEGSILGEVYRVTFFADLVNQYVQGVGSLAATLLFFYSAYQLNEWFKKKAFDDFKTAFELFEKELYTDFATHLNNSGYGLYLQLLLMREGKKVLSSQDLCMLQRDIINIKNFKSFDLTEAYVIKMKKSYQCLQ